MKKLLAFTLAETLIVIGIIGVVSALTLPNLNSSTGEKEKIAKVKKIYQNLDDAIGRASAIYGPLNEWKSLDNTTAAQLTRFGDRVTEFMKVSKNCGTSANQGCWSKTAPDVVLGGGFSVSDASANVYKVILADGTSLAMATDFNYISFDIDGPNKGANKLGKDVFTLYYDRDMSSIRPPEPPATFSQILTTGRGDYATNWVINFDNMDYLNAGSNGKCKSGNVTLNAVANPPVTSCK